MQQVKAGKKIIIVGCLAQKYGQELLDLIPEASAVVGTSDIGRIKNIIDDVYNNSENYHYNEVSPILNFIQPEGTKRFHITMGPSSYIKIAEGCDWHCTYCIIPRLKGKYRSRTIESIVNEAQQLADEGVSEMVLIAQDTSNYGIDIYNKLALPDLLKSLEKVPGIQWIRLMYTYPKTITDELIAVIASSEKIVKYLDMPLQHAHPEILKKMNRPEVDIEKLLTKLRTKIPNIAIRTCFIVGFPGETEEHFNYLLDFINVHKFDRLGVFEYSREKDTPAARLKSQVNARTKKQRYKKAMETQQKISLANHQSLIGKTIDVLLEKIDDSGIGVGRSYLDAPEIDGLVYVKNSGASLPGEIVPVNITKVNAYDSYGVAII